MKKVKVRNIDGEIIEIEVTKEIYDIYVKDKHNEIQREKYRDNVRFSKNQYTSNIALNVK